MNYVLHGLWAILALSPYFVWRDSEVGGAGPGLAVAAAYVAGWLLLAWAGRRDPGGEKLRTLCGGRVAPASLIALLLALQLTAALVSVGAALALLIVAGDLLFWLWARRPDGESLAASVANVLLLCGGLTLTFGALEIGFRLPFVVERTGGNQPGINRWSQKHYDRIWEGRPLRLRSLHEHAPKPDGTQRVVVVGDSFTWGYLIERTEDTWPYVAERLLRERGRNVEVVNLGRNGNSVFDNLRRLDELGWMFEPDLIVLQFTLNDPISGTYGSFFDLWPLVPGLNGYLNERSYFFSFMNSRWRQLQMAFRYPDGEAMLYREEHPGWIECRRAIAKAAAVAEQRGVPMLLALFPLFVPGGLDDEAYPFLEAHRSVLQAASDAGIPAVDLRPAFARTGRPGRSWWALPCDSHPDVEGHALAGEVIAEALDRGLGQPPEIERSAR